MARPIECDECGKKQYTKHFGATYIHVEFVSYVATMGDRTDYDFCNIRCLANWARNMAYD